MPCYIPVMQTVPDIINTLGGNAKVASALGLIPSTVSEMKRRQSIPVKYWPRIVAMSREAGKKLTFDKLVRLHSEAA